MFNRWHFFKATALLPFLPKGSRAGAIPAAQGPDDRAESRLLPFINDQYTIQTVHFADRDWTLDDYSYAGSYLGQQSLGSVPCNVVAINASGAVVTKTVVLLTPEEIDQATKKSVKYRAPGH